MIYLDNAPPALIRQHERLTASTIARESVPGERSRIERTKKRRTLNTVKLLEFLLCDWRMEKAWRTIAKSVVNDEDYEKLFGSIVEAMRLTRHDMVDQTARRERYRQIAGLAERLQKLVAEPMLPPHDGSGYRGELDFLRPEWPTTAELLEQLAIRARQQEDEPVSFRRRSRRFLPEETEEEVAAKTKARLFSCHLYDQFRKLNRPLKGLVAIRVIASVAYDVDLDSRILKKAIRDHRTRTVT